MRKRLATFAALGVAVLAATLAGGLAPLERGLDALRFRILARDVSAPVVVVAIDPKSLRALDVWPWARGYHATVLENLLAAGATRVGFDVDFSSRSIPEEDAELEAALAASEGRVVLPTFRQWEGGALRATSPLPRFARHAALGTINILPDGDGLVRAYRAPAGERSFAGALSGNDEKAHGPFLVDFALRPETIPEISYVDALTGSFDPALAEGRVAIVGATAVELGDQVAVPLHASLAGPTLQALSFASLAEGRALRRTAPGLGAAAALLVAIGLGIVLDRAPWRLGLLATIASILFLFAASVAVLAVSPVLVETGPGIAAAGSAYALALVRGLDRKSLEVLLASLRLHRTETAMRRVVERSFDAIVTVDGQGRIETWNPAAERLLGRNGTEIAGVPLSRFLTGVSSARRASVGEGEVSRDAGSPVPIDFTVGEIESEAGPRRVYVLRDATDRKAHESALLRRATHDALTDLPNRSLLALRADDRIRAREPLALVLLDLDRFREINDALGHDAGDALLREIAARFLARLAPGATLARLGGDEFGVLLPGAGEGEARAAAARLADGLAAPFEVRGLSLHVDASLGVALHPEHGGTGTELVQRADVAMYAAKREGRGLVVYRPELDFHGTRHLTLRADLARALETKELSLHYQPKVSARTGGLVGAEALARWSHPAHGVLPPEEFIGLAEHTGLIHPLTAFVLEEAATQWAAWRREGRSVGIAVNISARSLRGDDLVSRVGAMIRKHDLPPGALTLEITESVIMDDPRRALEVVTRLVDMGCRFSIDDFGTGYSSLAYLRRLPAREVKIDKSFVRGMENDAGNAVIVRSILDMAHHLGLEVVAEGVETPEAWDRLREAGCDYGQGWLFGKPAPAGELAVESFAVR